MLRTFIYCVFFLASSNGYCQSADSIKRMAGKWKLWIMKDSSGNAIDIAGTGDEADVDIYDHLEIKDSIITVSNGAKEKAGNWNYKNGDLSLIVNDKTISYKLIEITGNSLTMRYSIKMLSGEDYFINIYYKKEPPFN